MATEVEIVSRALVSLGANGITALNDGSIEATIASRFWLTTLDYLLSAHRWNFALKVAELVEDVPIGESSPGPYDDPIFPSWDYAYHKPSDLVRIERVMSVGKPIEWREIGARIATDDPPVIEIEYIYRPVITTLPAFFLLPLEHLLASRLAVPITQRPDLGQYYAIEFDNGRGRGSFPAARHIDSAQSTVERLPVGDRLRAIRA